MWMARHWLIPLSVSGAHRDWRMKRGVVLQERLFKAEEHLKARLAAGWITNQEAESLDQRIKNARAELVT